MTFEEYQSDVQKGANEVLALMENLKNEVSA
jgi:hypothetical protein